MAIKNIAKHYIPIIVLGCVDARVINMEGARTVRLSIAQYVIQFRAKVPTMSHQKIYDGTDK